MVARRDFLKLTGAGVIVVLGSRCTPFPFPFVRKAAIPGGTLMPGDVDKFVTPLLIPPVMPKAATLSRQGQPVDYYEISMRQFDQQVLPAGLPTTKVWGYGALRSESTTGLLLHHAPSLTIEALSGRAVRVKWINELVDANGDFLPHLLPVDPTLHWANPGGGQDGRDTRPTFTQTPGRYTGPVPIVTHVHGAVGVGEESDGYPEAWYLPAARNIPSGFALQGTWYDHFAGKALDSFEESWGPGFATFQYPNENRASTIWYHDHTLGMTRLNVYAGPAGFYMLRGGPTGDEAVIDTRTGTQAVLPGPAPRPGDPFPSETPYYEIPIAIQDRSFNTDGALFYPDTRAFFDEFAGPYMPASAISPIWNPEFFGNMMMVNGHTWPYLDVEQRRYRFRFLNGCDSRFLILDFGKIPGVEVWQIANEGGFLPAPVNLTSDHANKLLMTLAERADVIVDFTNVRPGRYVLDNAGPDAPYNGHEFDAADAQSTGQVLQFRVQPAGSPDPTTPPKFLALPPIPALPSNTTTRQVALLEQAESMPELDFEGPSAALLGIMGADGMPMHKMWSEPVTENPQVGDTETWEIYNFTADAHPIHVHELTFEVVNRQELETDEEGMSRMPAKLEDEPMPPEPWEAGRKDTVISYPGQVTRIRATFEKAGQFVWHCHIVSHEDNEMMRPYRIGPADPGAPQPHHM